MPGIDRNRVLGKTAEELDEFTCGICHDVFVNPMSTPCCRQTYCKNCIDEWLTEHNTCPHDRNELISDGLILLARFVLNLIDKMQIRCAYSEKGCPSVHTIGQDSEHLKVCEFARCGQCGREDPELNHNCLTHLLNVNLNVREEFEKLKTHLYVKSKEWSEKESQLTVNISELNKEVKHYKTLALPLFIIQAQKLSSSVEESIGFTQDWQKIINDICIDSIKKFDSKRHTYMDFVNIIKSRIVDKANKSNWTKSWTVAITANNVPNDLNTKNYFVRVVWQSYN